MTLISWKCIGCKLAIICDEHSVDRNAWMTDCVLITKTGSRYSGTYDGYGNIEHTNIVDACGLDDPCLWHRACWVKQGMPKTYTPSEEDTELLWAIDNYCDEYDKEKP